MPIQKNDITGTIEYTAPTDLDLLFENGVVTTETFAIVDKTDKLKQIKIDASSQATDTVVTLKSGAVSGDITLTLPATSGTLATTAQSGVSSVTSSDNTISGSVAGTVLDLQFNDPISWLKQKGYLWDDMWGWANSGATPMGWWTLFVSGGSHSYVYNNATITNGHPGVARLLVTTSAQYAALMTEQRQIVFDATKGRHTFEAQIKLEATATVAEDYELIIGFADNYTVATVAQGAYFEYNRATTGANWQAITKNGAGGTTTTDTGIAASTDWVTLKIVVDTAGHAIFYINGAQVVDTTTNLPSTSYPTNITLGVKKTGGSTARNLYMDYVYYEPKLTVSR